MSLISFPVVTRLDDAGAMVLSSLSATANFRRLLHDPGDPIAYG